jgi:hypothetical protein
MPVSIEKFDIDVRKLQKRVPVIATKVYRDLCLDVVEAAVVGNDAYGCPGTPVDQGFARGSWVVSLGKPASKGPSNPEKDATVALDSAKILTATLDQPVHVTSFAPYMKRLEYEGWSSQAPRGFVRLAIKAGKHMLRRILAKGVKV